MKQAEIMKTLLVLIVIVDGVQEVQPALKEYYITILIF